jgi:toxin ParE1/3/4
VSKPKFSLRLLRAAEEDLTEIVEYIAAENLTAAESILNRIEKDLQLLTRQPHLGRVPGDENLVRMGYRYLVTLDYLSFYTIEDQTILVHRIVHGARDYLRLL